MRVSLKKTVAVAMIAGAALTVAACGSKTENVNVTENSSMTETNAMEPMAGSMNDSAAMDNGMGASNATSSNATSSNMM